LASIDLRCSGGRCWRPIKWRSGRRSRSWSSPAWISQAGERVVQHQCDRLWSPRQVARDRFLVLAHQKTADHDSLSDRQAGALEDELDAVDAAAALEVLEDQRMAGQLRRVDLAPVALWWLGRIQHLDVDRRGL